MFQGPYDKKISFQVFLQGLHGKTYGFYKKNLNGTGRKSEIFRK